VVTITFLEEPMANGWHEMYTMRRIRRVSLSCIITFVSKYFKNLKMCFGSLSFMRSISSTMN
jgi:hypothetical protein